MDPDVLEILNVVRCNRHAPGASNSSNLSIGLGDWTPNEMARRDNLRKGAGSVAIKWQHASGKKFIEGTLASHSMASNSKSALLRAVARGSRVFGSPLARLGITRKTATLPCCGMGIADYVLNPRKKTRNGLTESSKFALLGKVKIPLRSRKSFDRREHDQGVKS